MSYQDDRQRREGESVAAWRDRLDAIQLPDDAPEQERRALSLQQQAAAAAARKEERYSTIHATAERRAGDPRPLPSLGRPAPAPEAADPLASLKAAIRALPQPRRQMLTLWLLNGMPDDAPAE